MKGVSGLLLMVVELIILIAILAGVTPTVMTSLTNLSITLTNSGQSMGSLLAANSLGGILYESKLNLISRNGSSFAY